MPGIVVPLVDLPVERAEVAQLTDAAQAAGEKPQDAGADLAEIHPLLMIYESF